MAVFLMRGLRRLGVPRCNKATSALEFALVAPLLITLAGAAADLGNAFQQSIRLGSAVRAGAQYATNHAGDSGGIEAAVSSAVSGWGSVDVTVDPMQCQCLDPDSGVGTGAMGAEICSLTCPGGTARYVTVHAVRPYAALFPTSAYVTFNTISQVSADVTVRIQ